MPVATLCRCPAVGTSDGRDVSAAQMLTCNSEQLIKVKQILFGGWCMNFL